MLRTSGIRSKNALPKTTSFRNEAGAIAIGVQIDRENRTLRYTRRLDVTSAVFAPNEQYVAIRDLYGEAVKHDAQNLALVRR